MRTRPSTNEPAQAASAEQADSTAANTALAQCISTHNDHITMANVVYDASVFSFDIHSRNIAYPISCHFDNTGSFKNANLPCAAPDGAANGGDLMLIDFDEKTGTIQLSQKWYCVETSESGSAVFR
jgi:hypothetical protein